MSEIIQMPMLIFPAILAVMTVFAFLSYRIIRNMFPRQMKTDEMEFDKLLSDAGYAYDPSWDIFITKMNAWQRKYGYCRLYDEACAAMSLIVDSEPVTFEYGGKRWLIEFWKGQYYLNTGCEIGVYYTNKKDLDIPNLFTGTFFKAVRNSDRLQMAYTLFKNGKELFHREEKHWWLTGFKTGEFSEPGELAVRARITFKDAEMCTSFLNSLKKLGYSDQEIMTNGVTAEFLFDNPRTEQPLTRTDESDWFVQRYNEHCCDLYNEATEGYTTFPEKLNAIREKEPFLFNAVVSVGKTRDIFKAFDVLKKYIKRFKLF